MPWLLKMTLLVALLMFMSHSYSAWRIRRTFAARAGLRWGVYGGLMSFYLLPLWGLVLFSFRGDVNMLALFHPLSYWFWFGFVFSVQLFSWLIVLDLLAFIARCFQSKDQSLIAKAYPWCLWGLCIILFVVTATKMTRDTRQIQVVHRTYDSPTVPQTLDGFRIVHITDIQGDEFTGRPEIVRYIKKINALHPDLVIFTGDLISYGTDFVDMSAEQLGRAKSSYGTYAVIGDHDSWAGDANITRALQKNDIRVLRDRNAVIATQSDSLLLTGITEVYSKHIPGDSLQNLTHEHTELPKILATHQATKKVINQAKSANYQLLLAGHTHGGQLRVPILFWTFSAAELDTPYLSGVFHFGDLLMNVDNGLGFTLAPVRYGAPPTISVIDLEAG